LQKGVQRDALVLSAVQCFWIYRTAGEEGVRLLAAPWTGRWQWLVLSNARHAFLFERVRSLRAQTHRPAYLDFYLAGLLVERAL
jgi:hypothetical protein